MNFTTIKNNKNIKTCLYFLGFLVSGVITGKLLTGLSSDDFSWWCMIGITIVIESAKGIFFFEALNKKHNNIIRIAFFLTWASIVIISLFASMAFTIGQNNATDNKHITNSVQYKTLEKNANTESDYYNVLVKEYDELKKININKVIEQDQTIKEYKRSRTNAKKNNWITTLGKGVNHYNSLIAKRSKEIKDKHRNDLNEAKKMRDNQKNIAFDSTNNLANAELVKDLKYENGITAMIGKNANWFFLFVAIIMEMVICLLFISTEGQQLLQEMDNTVAQPNKNGCTEINTVKNTEICTAHSKNTIGFKKENIEKDKKNNTEKVEINKNLLTKYIITSYPGNTKTQVPGQLKMAKELQIKPSESRAIATTLKQIGVLKTENRSTYFAVDKDEALKLI